MIKILSLDNMKKSDKFTCKNVINSKELMYKAAKAIYDNFNFYGKVGIVLGSGNNAGDGYCLATMLKYDNIDVNLLLIKEKFSEDGLYYFNKCKELNINYEIINNDTKFDYDILVDCIFGTGFKGDISDELKLIFDKYNNSNSYKISVDINSGLNGDTGIGNYILKSDLTFAIQYLKPGHFLNMAKDYIKDIKVLDIGIENIEKPYYLPEIKDFKAILNNRPNYSNKGNFGYVSLIGGSLSYSGAIKLSDLALISLKMGSGVSMIACPRIISNSLLNDIFEATIYPLSSNDEHIIFNENEINNLMKKCKAIAIGMGIGNNNETFKILEYLLLNYDKALLIDADALNQLSNNVELLNKTKAKIILTPHIKEFSRLINKNILDIKNNEIEYAKDFAKKYNVILLLKGPSTIITNGDDVYIVNRGAKGQATAGSGDVLSGILLGLLGYINNNLLLATALGAYINGLAGELAQREKTSYTMTSMDTINNISRAFEYILKELNID